MAVWFTRLKLIQANCLSRANLDWLRDHIKATITNKSLCFDTRNTKTRNCQIHLSHVSGNKYIWDLQD